VGNFLGWFGTLLGGVGLVLALSTAPSSWSSSHRDLFLAVVAMAIACLVIAVAVSAIQARGLIRRMLFRHYVRHAAKGRVRRALTLKVQITAIPGSPTGERTITFTTDREKRRLIPTLGRPAGLRITEPFKATVWANQVPTPVIQYGK
jgi:hypothetical protein